MASATMPNASLFLAEAELKIKQVGNKFATGVENKATKLNDNPEQTCVS